MYAFDQNFLPRRRSPAKPEAFDPSHSQTRQMNSYSRPQWTAGIGVATYSAGDSRNVRIDSSDFAATHCGQDFAYWRSSVTFIGRLLSPTRCASEPTCMIHSQAFPNHRLSSHPQTGLKTSLTTHAANEKHFRIPQTCGEELQACCSY